LFVIPTFRVVGLCKLTKKLVPLSALSLVNVTLFSFHQLIQARRLMDSYNITRDSFSAKGYIILLEMENYLINALVVYRKKKKNSFISFLDDVRN
jgi:hypothetical protein